MTTDLCRDRVDYVSNQPRRRGLEDAGNLTESQTAQVHGSPRRKGSLVVEMVVCTILLSVISLVLVPAIHAMQQQRQAIRFQTLSRIELNNLYQRLQEESKVASQNEAALSQLVALTDAFLARYPEATLSCRLPVASSTSLSAADGQLVPVSLRISTPQGLNQPDQECSVVVWLPAVSVAQGKEAE